MNTTNVDVLATIDKFLKVLNNSNGRDKCTKVLQYSTRIADDVLSSQESPNKEAIKRIQAFGGGIATARKVFRFWKPLVGYLALIRFIQRVGRISGAPNKEKPIKLIELLQMLEKLLISNYFLLDHLNWASKIGLLSNEPVKPDSYELKSLFNNSRTARYGTIGFTFWMYAALCGVAATTLELVDNVNQENVLMEQMTVNLKLSQDDTATKRSKELEMQVIQVNKQRNALIRKQIAAICDAGTAASLAGYWQTKNWFVGVMGVTSSLIGVYELWPEN
jgi:hypothetical protein